MPDFPKKGATAAEVWAESARTITALTGQPRTDLLGEDATFEAGTGVRKAKIDNVDVAITTRATPAQILVNPVNKVDGSLIDASVASRVAGTDFDTRLSDTRAAKIDNVDAAITTRAAPLDILAGVDKIDGSKIDASIASRAAESGPERGA